MDQYPGWADWPAARWDYWLLPPCRRRPRAGGSSPEPLYLFGIPVDFILFALTLLGVALFHHHTLYVALTGLAAILVYKLGLTGFNAGPGLAGLLGHSQPEWVGLANLLRC